AMDQPGMLILAGHAAVTGRAGSRPPLALGAGAPLHPEVTLLEQESDRRDAGPVSQSPAQVGAVGEAPPLHSAVATALCAGSALAGWGLGPGSGSLVLYALSYVAGGTMAALTAVAELRRGRLSVDLLMILAAAGAAVLGDWGEGAVL